MKVLLVNGSPHRDGCTNEALTIISEELAKYDIDTEKIWIRNRQVRGCVACEKCLEDGLCNFTDDCTNDIKKALSSVKMVLDANNDPIPEILKELAKYKIRAVWNKVDTNNSYEVKMGLRYKDMAFEVSN